jgi:hypothetical protein
LEETLGVADITGVVVVGLAMVAEIILGDGLEVF